MPHARGGPPFFVRSPAKNRKGRQCGGLPSHSKLFKPLRLLSASYAIPGSRGHRRHSRIAAALPEAEVQPECLENRNRASRNLAVIADFADVEKQGAAGQKGCREVDCKLAIVSKADKPERARNSGCRISIEHVETRYSIVDLAAGGSKQRWIGWRSLRPGGKHGRCKIKCACVYKRTNLRCVRNQCCRQHDCVEIKWLNWPGEPPSPPLLSWIVTDAICPNGKAERSALNTPVPAGLPPVMPVNSVKVTETVPA